MAGPSDTQCLRAQIADVRTLAALLRPIAFSTFATVSLSESGLTFTTEQDRSLQANAYVPSSLFSPFHFRVVRSPTRKRKRQVERSSQPSSATLEEGSSVQGSELREPEPLSPAALERAEREASERVRGAHHSPDQQEESGDEQDEEESSSRQTIDFDISLANFLQCLNIFGGAPALNKSSHSDQGAGSTSRERDKEATDGRGDVQQRYSRSGLGARKSKDGKGSDAGVTSAALTFDALSKRLVLILDDDGGATTKCELASYEPQGITDLAFDPDYLVAQAIMRSELLADAMSSVDPSASFVGLRFSPRYRSTASDAAQGFRTATSVSAGLRPSLSSSVVLSSDDAVAKRPGVTPNPTIQVLKLTADSDTGTVEMELPNERGVMERFVCNYDLEQRYNYKHMSTTTRALQTSIKTSLRIDERGLLSMQCLMPRGLGRTVNDGEAAPGRRNDGAALLNNHGFIEFTVLPLDEESLK
ncbi:hypothetical protein IE81DRAFT_368510 [Ceraceosorus guamensis]|uniref:Rad1-domain-containing protein n=1 Tax=Ceraceosorus guamensis TaxID=1522189 RepID=A0A316VS40_9BASI|nr:hypothetical protein IE81DRAFT_368510 [Ceraceosorus guamensis]PWN40180.1 hypothetical protein IE81DRAFT_368510 [Ceraceosorus guamensis]